MLLTHFGPLLFKKKRNEVEHESGDLINVWAYIDGPFLVLFSVLRSTCPFSPLELHVAMLIVANSVCVCVFHDQSIPVSEARINVMA